MKKLRKSSFFPSFLMGGYECTYALTQESRLDLLAATRHDIYCRSDYQLLKNLSIKTVREGLKWVEIDKGNNEYDFSRYEEMMKIAKEEGIKQIWDLNHYDYPEFIDPFSETFVTQFAEYAKRVVEKIRQYQDGTIFIVPINEISYFTYKAADKGDWAPFTINNGLAFKKQLVKASIAAMDAIRSVDHNVRFIQVDPILYRTPKEPVTPEKRALEEKFGWFRYLAWDMLCGKVAPELGGDPKYLDIIGVNYYMINQEWIVGDEWISRTSYQTMPFDSPDRISLATILKDIYERYNCPIVITETGGYQCPSELKAPWWKRIFKEVEEAVALDIPVEGICAYPILDMYDWKDSNQLVHPGLWDFREDDSELQRVPHTESIQVIREYFG